MFLVNLLSSIGRSFPARLFQHIRRFRDENLEWHSAKSLIIKFVTSFSVGYPKIQSIRCFARGNVEG